MRFNCQLVLFPGLGADERLLEPQKIAFPNLEVPPWIAPKSGERLSAYARRMAHHVSKVHPLVLGGVSLGGMLAWELARLVKPEALVLIASCRSPQAIARGLRWSGRLARLVPSLLIEATKPLAPLSARYLHRDDRYLAPFLVEMYRDTPAEFLRWGIQAACRWKPHRLHKVPVYQIHGAKDRIIAPRRSAADILVPGAGHLLNVTHADVVNQFIASVLQKASALEITA